MEKLIIDRSLWRTGNTGSYATGLGLNTALVNDQGYKCCLGFYCEQAGISTDKLLNIGTPSGLITRNKEFAETIKPIIVFSHGWYDNSPIAEKAMTTNDNESWTPEQKEEKVKALFAEIGTEVEFINDYTPYVKEDIS